MSTTTTLDTLKINYLTQAQYDAALANSEINENEIYLTPQDSSSGETDPVFSASAAAGITSSDITNWNSKTSNTGTVTGMTTTAGSHTAGAQTVSNGIITTNIPTKTSHLTNDSGFITSYTDEQLKWTASTSSNTYYPLQSTSTATTSTANTLNGISFYQYYNTAGGYRRLILGNSTAYTSTGGAYGTIRLYGTGATYYGDLNPGTIESNSLTANRTWTLPDKTGTIALTSDIPDVSGFITTDSDEKLKIAAVTSGTTYYPIVATNSTTAANRQYDSTGIAYTGTNGTANGSNGNALLALGNSTASTTANWKKGTVRLYGTTAYYTDLVSGAPSANRTITFPNKTGTVALTDDIPTIPTNISAFTNDSGYITSADVPEGASAYTGTISAVSTTASNGSSNGFARGDHVHNITSATIVSALGFTPISTDSDENVKSTAVTAATTNYIVGSTTSTTTTGGLSKHASAILYTTTDSGTGGYTQLRLGNTTATSSAGGKEGQIRLYGTTATYYVDLRAGAPSANRTITFPNATGTVALTSNIPTKTSDLTNDSGFITSDSDTKNTAGSTDTSSKIFLIGATSQADNPQTYSHDTAYVGTDGCLYSGGSKVLTAHQTATATPTANTVSKFDGSAHMNSTDMSASEITSFIGELGTGVPALIDLFYPVGSYYETSNSSFNPNNAWGGTWEKEAEGLVHIGSGSTYSLGATGGEATHKLTIDEMPSHNHDLPRVMGFVNSTSGGNGTYGSVSTWTTVGNRGGDGAHNNMQPYVVVNRWHRTA